MLLHTSLLVVGSHVLFSCYYIAAYSFKRLTANKRKQKVYLIDTNGAGVIKPLRARAIFRALFSLIAIACGFWRALFAFFG